MGAVLNVLLPGHIDPCDSLAKLGCELARGLTCLGVGVNLLALGKREMPNQDDELAAIVNAPRQDADGAIVIGWPTAFAHHGPALWQGKASVALVMWESTRCPPAWAPLLNQFDAVVTPCRFCADVFTGGGVTVPIHVVALGVSTQFQPRRRTGDGPMTFLAFLDRGKRKGGLSTLTAFVRAFGDDPDYRLILKARHAGQPQNILNPNVDLIQQDMSEAELYELYLRADCLVFATLGEGWGLPPREFAATGGIALATNFSGTADEIEQWGIPLSYRLQVADWTGVKSLAGLDLGEWAEIDIDELAAALRDVAANRAEYLAQAWQKAQSIHSLYSWQTFAERVYHVWKEATHERTYAQ